MNQSPSAPWDMYVRGDVEAALLAFSEVTRKPFGHLYSPFTGRKGRTNLKVAKYLRVYPHPRIQRVSPALRNQFGLAVAECWLHALYGFGYSDHPAALTPERDRCLLREMGPLAALLGTGYSLDLDPAEMRRQVEGDPLPDLSAPNDLDNLPVPYDQLPELFPELASLPSLSAEARRVFVRAALVTNLQSGLAEYERINPCNLPSLSDAMLELAFASVISLDLTRADLLMGLTLRDLKKLAFDEGLQPTGPKHRLVEMLVAQLSTERIDAVLSPHGRTPMYVRVMISNLPTLKKYIRAELNRLELYRRWVERVECLHIPPMQIDGPPSAERPPYEANEPALLGNALLTQADVTNFLSRPSNRLMVERLGEIWDSNCDDIVCSLAAQHGWRVHTSSLISAAVLSYLHDHAAPAFRRLVSTQGSAYLRADLDKYGSMRIQQMGAPCPGPRVLTCAGCGKQTRESSITPSIAERVRHRILFCDECYRAACWHGQTASGKPTSEDDMLAQLSELAVALRTVPTQGLMSSPDLSNSSDEQQQAIVLALLAMPSYRAYKKQFGSWLNALVKAGVLDEGTLLTARGIRCIASDGHECHSLAERTIDDWLTTHGVAHEREPHYPYHVRLNPSGMRADWLVGTTFIEYAGLMEQPDYAAKIETKRELATGAGIPLIVLQPQDVLALDVRLSLLSVQAPQKVLLSRP